mmetsp:Transcript_10322/g.22982  ORF Transcript_10322/g.22982 Transcript_10322/m.22982 type:complete len:597 (-) Transcript_10322:109-1899(-)
MSVAAPCTILTSAIFDIFAPAATRNALYTYAGFCSAINSWNTINAANAANQIFMGSTELDRRHELAAFFGNTMHESDHFQASREYYMCQTTTTVGGTVYCDPTGYNGGTYNDPYCNSALTALTNPNGCTCGTISESSQAGYLEADSLFLGRGPIQLSWNYNYIDAGAALSVDLCTNPDLVATDSVVAWGTALWFWMTSGGQSGTTCHDSVISNADFGGTLHTINGGNECPAASGFDGSVVSRLDDYCTAATSLGVGLLGLTNCNGLQTAFDECISTGGGSNGVCTACDGVTAAPTEGPTSAPTPPPTNPIPTKSPTSAPTPAPTTLAPTPPPTTAPPTQSPTPRPTRSPSPFLWYPDWSGADQGCANDGNEPNYMTNNPSAYMYSELSDCCTKHYNWIYDTCMYGDISSGSGGVGTGLYFPDWLGMDICELDNDGSVAPDYMSSNPNGWMKSTLDDCCMSYYQWNYDVCFGNGGTTSAASWLYYPNWSGGTNECLDDGNQPAYMTNYQSMHMHTTLESCCEFNYSWDIDTCMAGSGVVATGISRWYINWNIGDGECVQDCTVGTGSCGGLAHAWNMLYNSQLECCHGAKWWDEDCF